MKTLLTAAFCASLAWLTACGGGGGSVPGPLPSPSQAPSPSPLPYLPLKVGDTWTYACYRGTPAPGASAFPKTNQVIGTATVGSTLTYEYQEQIPSSPTMSTTRIELLANDAAGNTILYGYIASPSSSPNPVTPTVIVPQQPGPPITSFYDYPAPGGGTTLRLFCCTGPTNPTVFGVFTVNEFFDGSHTMSTSTDGYGYALGKGEMEEDHNFNSSNRLDCIVTATPPP